ncbi:RIF1 [Candida margitis]|uniref:RIF1 n=1 Tax=Candida margitis TaxID=1775924 RepID=UPI002225FD00|nr:RIF1 [Candida margitis]KAI5969159.1 RIF1 [Candida margitis]
MAPVRRSTRNSKGRANSPKKQNSSPIGVKRRTNKKSKSISSSKGEVVREKSPNLELNSSPIRQVSNLQDTTPTKPKRTPKKRKCVLFSDDLISDLPSTPERGNTPIRSILKPCDVNSMNELLDPNNTSLWGESTHSKSNSPKSAEFWLPGTIIQLEPGSEGLPMLVEGCLAVLGDSGFKRRFEVYATLNSIFKSNPSTTLIGLFLDSGPAGSESSTKQSKSLPILKQIIKDIDEIEEVIFNPEADKENVSPTKGNPFKIRIVTQALKLLNLFMSDAGLNNFIANEDAYWIYDHACTMLINPNISKALVSPYLSIIKDCKLNPGRRRALFCNHEILEKLLIAVLRMNNFPSSSLVTERFSCLRNYILNFPEFMAKNIAQWFEPVLLNLCNMVHPVYMKSFGVGVHCLLEAAKCFLDDSTVHSYVINKLSSPIAADAPSFTSDQEFPGYLSQLRLQNVRLIEFVVCKLEELISADQQKLAMDMWMGLTLLAGSESFDKWTDLNVWLKVPMCCFSSTPQASPIALSCWRAICFILCRNGLESFRKSIDSTQTSTSGTGKSAAVTQALKSKVKLLMYVFNSFPIEGLSKDVIETLHNIFLGHLYVILSPAILKSWSKYLPLFWDRIIQPTFGNFYFKRESGSYANQLGLELLTTMLKSSLSNPEKQFNDLRILSNDPITLMEVNPLPARYAHSHFDRVMQSMFFVFQLDTIKFEQKLSLFTTFLAKLKLVVKKEQKPTATTYDLIDNLSLLLKKLFQKQAMTSETLVRVIVAMHDTFNPYYLVNRDLGREGFDCEVNVYMPVIESSNPLPIEGRSTILRLILQSLSQTKALIFIADTLSSTSVPNDTLQIFTEVLNKSKIDANTIDLQFYGIICKYANSNYEVFVKKVIQSIVSIPNSDEICRCLSLLHIDEWSCNVGDYVLLLLRNAPSKSIHHFVAGVISRRLESALIPTLEFVTKNDFASEMFLLSGNLFDLVIKLDNASLAQCCSLLEGYLMFKSKQEGNDYLLIDILGAGCNKYLRMDIGFLGKMMDLTHLPLCSRELQLRKDDLRREVICPPSIPTYEQGDSNEDIDMSDTVETVGHSLELAKCSPMPSKVGAETNQEKRELIMIESAESVRGDKVFEREKPRNSMAIENLVDGEMKEEPSRCHQSELFPSTELTVIQNIHERTPIKTAPIAPDNINATIQQSRDTRVEESTSASSLSAPELVKLLTKKSNQDLNELSPEQKYELESSLLQFMVKLRGLQ